MSEFVRDEDGNLVNPPVIPEYEQKIAAAQSAADQSLLDQVQQEYHDAREDLARESEDRQQDDDDDGDDDPTTVPAPGDDDPVPAPGDPNDPASGTPGGQSLQGNSSGQGDSAGSRASDSNGGEIR